MAGINPVCFIKDFSERFNHGPHEDVKMTLDGRAGI
jgi:hypothetical protein